MFDQIGVISMKKSTEAQDWDKTSSAELHIVLVEPEIPPNTGNIARLCACNDWSLHLVKPLGFSLEEKQLKRAGLDYWDVLKLTVHENWGEFEEKEKPDLDQCSYFLSAKAKKSFWEAPPKSKMYLVFGSETKGLPPEFHQQYFNRFFQIPMLNPRGRCLNLSTSVGIAAYEMFRKSASTN